MYTLWGPPGYPYRLCNTNTETGLPDRLLAFGNISLHVEVNIDLGYVLDSVRGTGFGLTK